MRSFVASEGHPPLIMLVTCTMHAATGDDSTRGISRVAAPAAAPRPRPYSARPSLRSLFRVATGAVSTPFSFGRLK